jgi:hypothetical protein
MIHMDYHTNLRKSEEAQAWDDEQLKALDAHINEHYMFILLLQKQQSEAGAAGQEEPGKMAPTAPQEEDEEVVPGTM